MKTNIQKENNKKINGIRISTLGYIFTVISIIIMTATVIFMLNVNDKISYLDNDIYEDLCTNVFYLNIALCALILVIFIFFILMFRLVIKPIDTYTKDLKDTQFLKPHGSYELKYFAYVYNKIYKINLKNQKKLTWESERDSLTNLYNKNFYDNMLSQALESSKDFALVLVDIDDFRNANTSHGQSVGDAVIKLIGEQLTQYFKGEHDYVCRIGGDEFAVILSGIDQTLADTIVNRIDVINHNLISPEDNLPPCSISVGVAFKSDSINASITACATEALALTRLLGKSGCNVYKTNVIQGICNAKDISTYASKELTLHEAIMMFEITNTDDENFTIKNFRDFIDLLKFVYRRDYTIGRLDSNKLLVICERRVQKSDYDDYIKIVNNKIADYNDDHKSSPIHYITSFACTEYDNVKSRQDLIDKAVNKLHN